MFTILCFTGSQWRCGVIWKLFLAHISDVNTCNNVSYQSSPGASAQVAPGQPRPGLRPESGNYLLVIFRVITESHLNWWQFDDTQELSLPSTINLDNFNWSSHCHDGQILVAWHLRHPLYQHHNCCLWTESEAAGACRSAVTRARCLDVWAVFSATFHQWLPSPRVSRPCCTSVHSLSIADVPAMYSHCTSLNTSFPLVIPMKVCVFHMHGMLLCSFENFST